MIKGISLFSKSRATAQRLRAEGDAGMRQRNWPRAIEAYRAYLLERPDDAAIWVQFGHALKESGLFLEAETAYGRALKVAPDDGDARLHYDDIAARLARNATSKTFQPLQGGQEAFLEAEPGREPQSDSGARSRGDSARDLRDWHSAAMAYCEHLASHPRDAAIWVQLGHMLKEQSFYEEALYAYQVGKHLETEPSDVTLHLAFLLMHCGRQDDAKPLWADMFRKNRCFFLPDT